jgi:hypothetical protein
LEFSYLLYKRYSVWQRNYYQILQTLPFLNFECLKRCFEAKFMKSLYKQR